jgi:hypothetical protein
MFNEQPWTHMGKCICRGSAFACYLVMAAKPESVDAVCSAHLGLIQVRVLFMMFGLTADWHYYRFLSYLIILYWTPYIFLLSST